MRIPLSMTIWLLVVGGLLGVAFLAGIVPWTSGVVAIVAVCLVCELVDSSLGMGYGTTLTPVLLAAGFEPHQLVPTILVSEFLSGFASFFFHAEAGNVRLGRGSLHLRAGVLLAVFSLVGVFAGVQLAVNLPAYLLSRVIGIIILAAGLTILATSNRRMAFRLWKVGALGVVASFNKAVSGGGYGPLMTSGQILSGVDGKAAVALTSFAEGFTCLAGASLFLILGQRLDPGLLIPVVGGALLSVPFSAQVVRVTHEKLIRLSIAVLTIALGVWTVVRTLGG